MGVGDGSVVVQQSLGTEACGQRVTSLCCAVRMRSSGYVCNRRRIIRNRGADGCRRKCSNKRFAGKFRAALQMSAS